MKNIKIYGLPFLTVAILYSFIKPGNSPKQTNNAKELVQNAVNLMNGKSSESKATMSIVRPKWTRTISMKTWSLGNDFNMILITAPAEDKGQSFLKRQNEMWNWIPSISRIIRIPPSMMGQSWMGSDFTNNDLVKRNSLVNDYTQSIVGTETLQGYECSKIEMKPLKDAAVIWGKVVLWIANKKYFILKAEYYDEDGALVNLETQSDIKHFGDRDIPSKVTIEPVKEKGQKTILEFQNIQFNINLKEEFFSQQNMKNLE